METREIISAGGIYSGRTHFTHVSILADLFLKKSPVIVTLNPKKFSDDFFKTTKRNIILSHIEGTYHQYKIELI